MPTVLVAVDFATNVQPLLDATRMLGGIEGAKFRLLHVAAPEPDFVSMDPGPQYERDDMAHAIREEREKLFKLAEQLRGAGLDVEARIHQGSAVDEILHQAHHVKADLLVVGWRKHGVIHRLFAGDVATSLLHSANIPLLIVPLVTED
jgi:nucleotide-binding universal stress UspA family protein